MTERSEAVDAALAAGISDAAGGDARQAAAGEVSPSSPAVPAGAGPPALPIGRAVSEISPRDLATIDPGDDDETGWWLYLPSWLASTVVHLALVLGLATATMLIARSERPPSLVVRADGEDAETGELEDVGPEFMTSSESLDELLAPAPIAELPPTATDAGDIGPLLPGGELPPLGESGEGDALLADIGATLAMRLDDNMRQELLHSGGGTAASEEAVGRALQWLAQHQTSNGSWSFQHQKHPECAGKCGNPGYTLGNIAATSMALLPFLGTGQTQYEGRYKQNVERGLKYLVRTIKYEGDVGGLWDAQGTMYGHGLASIALCEAYGMTHDVNLRDPAQAVINFIVEAQDKTGGGWRYYPQTPGDTSVVGWQVMALKSAEMAYLRVPHDTLRKAGYFLDSVQGERGAVYGYQRPEARRAATSAIGLLCRMYLGWDHDYRPLGQGVKILSTLGPSTDRTAMRNNMYYNYYATQVLHHWGGSDWVRWNQVMREYLIETQSTKGHEYGSWYFDGADHGSGAGGRLYCTALAAMTLEVYYRHMPLYRAQSVND